MEQVNRSFQNYQSQNKTRDNVIFIVVLLMLICFYPYEFFSAYFLFLPTLSQAYITVCIFLVVAFIVVFSSKSNYCQNAIKPLYSVACVSMLGVMINAFLDDKLHYIPERMVFMLLPIFLIIMIEKVSSLESFFQKYNRWIYFMSICAASVFILATMGAVTPLYPFPDRAEIGRFFQNYIVSFAVDSGEGFRCSGFFDEPGALAYWCMYTLVINKLFIDDRKIEIPLIISALFTFSVGFYVQLILYFVLFYINKYNIGKSLIIIVCVFLFLQGTKLTKGTSFEFIYKMSYERIENIFDAAKENDSALMVDDREDITKNAIKEFEAHPFWGSPDASDVGNNIYEPLAMYGIFGSFFFLFPFIWLLFSAVRNKDIDMIKGLSVLILGFTHRPFRQTILYLFIIFAIIVLYKKRHIEQSVV